MTMVDCVIFSSRNDSLTPERILCGVSGAGITTRLKILHYNEQLTSRATYCVCRIELLRHQDVQQPGDGGLAQDKIPFT